MPSFQELVLSIAADERSLQVTPGMWNQALNTCWFGIPAHEGFGRKSLARIPADAAEFHFLQGGSAAVATLLDAFCRSPWAQHVKVLTIGCSCASKPDCRLDYEEALAAVANAHFPELQVLRIGTWTLFSNSHCRFGSLGDLSPLLRNCPTLKTLDIGGHFSVSEVFHHRSLQRLRVQTEDSVTCSQPNEISQQTLYNLLSGELPLLRELVLDLEMCEPGSVYTLPERLLAAENVPAITSVDLTGNFPEREESWLHASPLGHRAMAQLYRTADAP